jgi:hypothetical protein
MGGRARKSAGKKSTGQSSSTTTTTDKDFGPQLKRNNVVFTSIDARAPDDIDEIRELLDRPRESEPPDRLAFQQYLANTEEIDNEPTIQHSAYTLLKSGRPSGKFQATRKESIMLGRQSIITLLWA